MEGGRDSHDGTISLHYEIWEPASTKVSNPKLIWLLKPSGIPKYQLTISGPVHHRVEHKQWRKLLIKINRLEGDANISL
jgi:hypothetical protein